MANDRVYIHEFIDIRGTGRARYMHHMTANWSPIGQKERDQRCFGVWGTLGSTGRWPQVVNMWEEKGFAGLARNFAHETQQRGMQDPSLREWWVEAAKFRRGGVDRILLPAAYSPTIDELVRDGVCGDFYAHELVQVRAGAAADFLERVPEHAEPAYAMHGLRLVGAFRTAMRNDAECLLLWAIPDHEAWARFEMAHEPGGDMRGWRDEVAPLLTDWERILLVDAPTSTLRLGRQPAESDRRPLDEI